MADLFLSYAHKDIKAAETLARLLETNGLDVWWDRRMVAGDHIHEIIDTELHNAKAVIVLWSAQSVNSDWVLGEAQTARDLDKFVPIKIEECRLPIPYRHIHTPEVYRTKNELDKLAQLLSEKFKPVERRATTEEEVPDEAAISFSPISSNDFIVRLAAQHVVFKRQAEQIERSPQTSWFERQLKRIQLAKKYPLGALTAALLFLAIIVGKLLVPISGPLLGSFLTKTFGKEAENVILFSFFLVVTLIAICFSLWGSVAKKATLKASVMTGVHAGVHAIPSWAWWVWILGICPLFFVMGVITVASAVSFIEIAGGVGLMGVAVIALWLCILSRRLKNTARSTTTPTVK